MNTNVKIRFVKFAYRDGVSYVTISGEQTNGYWVSGAYINWQNEKEATMDLVTKQASNSNIPTSFKRKWSLGALKAGSYYITIEGRRYQHTIYHVGPANARIGARKPEIQNTKQEENLRKALQPLGDLPTTGN